MPSPTANTSHRRTDARATLLAVAVFPEADGLALRPDQKAGLLAAVSILEQIEDQQASTSTLVQQVLAAKRSAYGHSVDREFVMLKVALSTACELLGIHEDALTKAAHEAERTAV